MHFELTDQEAVSILWSRDSPEDRWVYLEGNDASGVDCKLEMDIDSDLFKPVLRLGRNEIVLDEDVLGGLHLMLKVLIDLQEKEGED